MTVKRLMSLAAVSAVLAWGGWAHAADISLTGDPGDPTSISFTSFNSGGTHFDFGFLTLSNFGPFVVSEGDTFTVDVTLSGPFHVPASGFETSVALLLTGDNFPDVITETYGTLSLFNLGVAGPSETVDTGDGIGSRSQLVTEVNLIPPDNGAFDFDSATATFTVHGLLFPPGTIDQTVSLNSAQLEYVLTSAAVPEPASWALMLVGFGGMGGVLRSLRRRAFA
jgi:hypothetical protein